jgi:hypothetical protein
MDGRRVRNTSHLVLQRPGVGEVLNNFACSDPDPLLRIVVCNLPAVLMWTNDTQGGR